MPDEDRQKIRRETSNDKVTRIEIIPYPNNFSRVFSDLLERAHVSRYQISKYSGLDESYLSRLKNGKKSNPSLDTVVIICLALVHFSRDIRLSDIAGLVRSAGYSVILNRRLSLLRVYR